jgi:nucleotide-binding universal stress UspA family protein
MTSKHAQIVVGFDFSQSGNAALDGAIDLVASTPSHVLHVVCVIEPHRAVESVSPTGAIDHLYAEQVQHALSAEIELRLRAVTARRANFYVHARIGKPSDEILMLAQEVGADLIIVGSKGSTGLTRIILGSVSERVVREAGCAVEVVRPKSYATVDLLQVIEVEPHHTYVPPHRYSYEENRMNLRPRDWPLY